MTASGGSGSVVAAAQASGWVWNHAYVSGSGAAPGSSSSTASNSPCRVPSSVTATEAKERMLLRPGAGPSTSMSVTT